MITKKINKHIMVSLQYPIGTTFRHVGRRHPIYEVTSVMGDDRGISYRSELLTISIHPICVMKQYIEDSLWIIV